MQHLIPQFSALIGLLLLAQGLLADRSIEHVVFTSFGMGSALYVVLLVGSVVVQRIAAMPPKPVRKKAEEGEGAEEDAAPDA